MDFRLTRMWAAYKRQDPPPKRVKPVPLRVLRHLICQAAAAQSVSLSAITYMACLAFFFLLRPGEYTSSPSDTTPFTSFDVQLFVGHLRLDLLTSTDADLCRATFATLEFTNQKNGVRGEVIGLGRSGSPFLCPVKIIATRVIHLRTHAAPPATPLSRYFSNGRWHNTTPSDISAILRQAVRLLGPSLGFVPSDVSARSLRAAGAMALLCAGIDHDRIKLIGRWRSDEMLRYLHVQAAPVMRRYAQAMVTDGDFSLIPNHAVPLPMVPLH